MRMKRGKRSEIPFSGSTWERRARGEGEEQVSVISKRAESDSEGDRGGEAYLSDGSGVDGTLGEVGGEDFPHH